MLYFPETDTGYYEDESSFYAHDRELEVAEANREARLEWEAEEMLARAWEGEKVLDDAPQPDSSPASFGMELSTGQMLSARFGSRRRGGR